MTLKAAFIFLSAEGDPNIHNGEVNAESVSVTTFAVNNYVIAGRLAQQLVIKGFNAIELCGGFGVDGVAHVKQAIANKVPVGVVRFDCHPGLNYQSGDDLFK